MKTLFRDNVLHDILVVVCSFLLAWPLFLVANHYLPDLSWPLHADRILLFGILTTLLILILRVFRLLVSISILVFLLWLGYGSFTGNYGFGKVYDDYRFLLMRMQKNPDPGQILFADYRQIEIQKQLLAAIEDHDPAVRKFAVQASNEYFKPEQKKIPAYRNLLQCMAVFKKINRGWNYVDDPSSREYFAPASESVQLMAGDCDDHTILMVSAIKSVGGTARMVFTTGHVYPELYIGNRADLDQVNYLIKKILFTAESRGQDIHYHLDADGKVWINLDYTAHYPGGKFMAEPVLGILEP